MKPPEFLIQDSRNIMMSLQITKLSKKYFINFLIIRYTVIGMGVLNPELLGHFINIQVHQQLFFFKKRKIPKGFLLFSSRCASHYRLAFSISAVN